MNIEIDNLSGRQRFMIAGLGGIMPVLLSLIVIDLQIILLNVTKIAVASYLIRVFALFAVGGLVGWLHRKEIDPVKLFQLGIAAPALITAAINGGNVTLPNAPIDQNKQASWNVISQAYAQTTPEQGLKHFSLPEETSTQMIYRGFFGALQKNVWFVIAGSHLTREAAEKQVGQISKSGFSADVYAPYGGNPYYAVVIGAQLELSEARKLQQKAVASGLPKDTYLWTFPPR